MTTRAGNVRIGYVCDGGGDIGWGHIWRGRAIVDAAAPGSELLVGNGYNEILSEFGARGGITTAVRQWHSPAAPLDPVTSEFDILVVDDYHLAKNWIEAASRVIPTYVVDDWMRPDVSATGVVNPNVDAQRSDYALASVEECYTGLRYALIRAEVREMARNLPLRDEPRTLLVTLGGSDPRAVTADVVATLAELRWLQHGEMVVILGASYRGPEPWEAAARCDRSARIKTVRGPADYLSRCANADLIVCGASTSSNEFAYLGLPFVPMAFVDNQSRVSKGWSRNGIGTGLDTRQRNWRAGLAEEVARLLDSAPERRDIARRGAGLVDGRGIERLLAAWSARAAA